MEIFAFTQIAVTYEGPSGSHQLRPITLPKLQRVHIPSSRWLGLATAAISLSIVLAAPSAIAAVRRGDRGAEVTQLQTGLQRAGYSVSVDGVFGPGTEDALRRFQAAQGLVVDGVAGTATFSRLSGTVTTSSTSSSSGTLRFGNSGPSVTTLQNQLQALGFFPTGTRVTGYYGTVTQTAVMNFQRARGLTADGIAGPATQGQLSSGSVTPTSATPSSTSSSGTFRRGDSSTAIATFQNRLKELSYFPQSLNSTGFYGQITEDAVKAFQRNNNLTVDGIAGPATQSRANSSSAIPASGSSPGTVTVANASSDSFRSGDRGPAIVPIQNRLKDLGYFDRSVNSSGIYGPITESAVRDFQRANGLTADGIAGPATQGRLNSPSALPKDSTPPTAPPPATPSDPPPSVRSVLQEGDTGSAVEALQNRLIGLGYLSPPASGIFDAATASAVRAFQSRNGLEPDGVVGRQTQYKLDSNAVPAGEPIPIPPATLIQIRTVRTNGADLPVYSAPNISAPISQYLGNGRSVETTGISNNGWAELVIGGWVDERFLFP